MLWLWEEWSQGERFLLLRHKGRRQRDLLMMVQLLYLKMVVISMTFNITRIKYLIKMNVLVSYSFICCYEVSMLNNVCLKYGFFSWMGDGRLKSKVVSIFVIPFYSYSSLRPRILCSFFDVRSLVWMYVCLIFLWYWCTSWILF